MSRIPTEIINAGFGELVGAIAPLSSLPAQWFVAGGWAIDLFVGAKTREHSDVDIGIARGDQMILQAHLVGWSFEKVVPRAGMLVREPWPKGDWLDLPVHEVHARSTRGARLEFLLQERDGDRWIYRRDARVWRAWDEIVISAAGKIPALAPEAALLFKAKGTRTHDESDFLSVLSKLPAPGRRWLRHALQTSHPGHPWLRAPALA